MTEHAPLVIILCAQCKSAHPGATRGAPPRGLGRACGAAELLGDVSGTLTGYGADS